MRGYAGLFLDLRVFQGLKKKNIKIELIWNWV